MLARRRRVVRYQINSQPTRTMKRLALSLFVVAAMAGCASNPSNRAQVATQESARLPAPSAPLAGYASFELKRMAWNDDIARDASKVQMSQELDTRVQARLQPLLSDWNARGAKSGKALIVQPRVVGMRVVGGATRFWAGAFAGDSSIDMELELRDAASGAVIAKPRVTRSANAMAGAWSIGASDRNLLDYIADISHQYLVDNRR
jgi:hypothetical protein